LLTWCRSSCEGSTSVSLHLATLAQPEGFSPKVAAPLTLDQLLQEGNADGLQHVINNAGKSGVPMLDESNITFGRLFKNPGKIACVGLNYKQHAKEIGMQLTCPPRLVRQ
jgi:2-keto-4-pentenoate hydratase/2-oxohepta-3-ene-1,7-dioic acid hydratase in catechol pathway